MPQDEMTKETLAELLEGLCSNRDKLIEMGFKARALAKPQATAEVAAICAEMAGYDFDKTRGDNVDDDEFRPTLKVVSTYEVDDDGFVEMKYETA